MRRVYRCLLHSASSRSIVAAQGCHFPCGKRRAAKGYRLAFIAPLPLVLEADGDRSGMGNLSLLQGCIFFS